MSISLNNINSEVIRAHRRIDELEKSASSGKLTIEKIWSGKWRWDGGTLRLGDLSKYLIVYIRSDSYGWIDFAPVIVTGRVEGFKYGNPWGMTMHRLNTANGDLTYTGTYSGDTHDNNYITDIYGLKKN